MALSYRITSRKSSFRRLPRRFQRPPDSLENHCPRTHMPLDLAVSPTTDTTRNPPRPTMVAWDRRAPAATVARRESAHDVVAGRAGTPPTTPPCALSQRVVSARRPRHAHGLGARAPHGARARVTEPGEPGPPTAGPQSVPDSNAARSRVSPSVSSARSGLAAMAPAPPGSIRPSNSAALNGAPPSALGWPARHTRNGPAASRSPRPRPAAHPTWSTAAWS